MCYMTLCCRKITTNAETVIDLCMGTGKGFPDLEHFEALGLRHIRTATYCQKSKRQIKSNELL